MPDLIPPDERVRKSFIAAMEEFRAEGRGHPSDHTMIGSEIRGYRAQWSTLDGFRHYVKGLRDQALEDSPRPEGYVPCTTLWWVEGGEYLGRIAIRHRLTPSLLEFGGHIGYDIRATARRRGHATAMLRTALPVAASLGIDPALITCDATNVASRRVIESCGGVLEDQRGDKLRFWVPTRRSPIVGAVEWGRIEVRGFGSFKDAKLFPGGAQEWDWAVTGTRHSPGFQTSDVQGLLDSGADIIVLSRGMQMRLEVSEQTTVWLEQRGVQVRVAETQAAVRIYNELAAAARPVGALLHSTC